jgi:hypothetical protein
MTLTIFGFDGETSISTAGQLRAALFERDPKLNANSFLIVKDGSDYPQLGIFFRGDRAVLQYMGGTEDGNYISQGSICAGSPRELIFYENKVGATVQLPAEAVVCDVDAVEAAVEFFETNKLPAGIKWLEI